MSTPEKPIIDGAARDQIDRAYLAGIIKRVKAGKTISKADREILESASEPKGRAPRSQLGVGDKLTRTQISKRLGMDRGTLAKYLGMEGAPKPDERNRYSLKAVEAWREANALRIGNTQEMRTIKEAQARLELQKSELEFGIMQNRYVPRTEIRPGIEAVMGRLTVDMTAIFEGEIPPKCAGKTTIEIRELMAAAVDRVLKRMKEGWGQIA